MNAVLASQCLSYELFPVILMTYTKRFIE